MQLDESQLEFYEEIWNQITEEGNEFHLNFTLRIMHKFEVIKWISWALSAGKDPSKLCQLLEVLYTRGIKCIDRLERKP